MDRDEYLARVDRFWSEERCAEVAAYVAEVGPAAGQEVFWSMQQTKDEWLAIVTPLKWDLEAAIERAHEAALIDDDLRELGYDVHATVDVLHGQHIKVPAGAAPDARWLHP